MVTICTASLTFSNSTFCPHSVFMCFVWICEQTAITSLYNINWLVFITEMKRVYCAVRTEFSCTSQVNMCLPKNSFTNLSFIWWCRPKLRFCAKFSLLFCSRLVLILRRTRPLTVTRKFWYNFGIISVVFNLYLFFSVRMLDYQLSLLLQRYFCKQLWRNVATCEVL